MHSEVHNCCFAVFQSIRFRFFQLTHRLKNVHWRKKKLRFSYILTHSGAGCEEAEQSTPDLEELEESNTKKRIRMFFFEYAHGAFSYFQGQISKLSFKFCFACYSFPLISCSPVNMGISFINKVDAFEGCLENIFNIKDIMGKKK